MYKVVTFSGDFSGVALSFQNWLNENVFLDLEWKTCMTDKDYMVLYHV